MKETTVTLYDPIIFQSNLFDYRKGSVTMNNGNEIFMEHRLKELFVILLKHKNDFVSREELMAFVWKDIIVSEQSVSKAISDLPKFISTNEFRNLKIITVRKLGYKLEIEESSKINNNFLKPSLRIFAYTIGIIAALIIIVRAVRYEQ